MDAHRIAEQRSVAYHRAVAERLRCEPALLEVARERVRKWSIAGVPAAYYAQSWSEMLDRSLDDLTAFLSEDSEHAAALRQVTPFAGFLDPRDRWRIWREVRARCEAEP